MRWLRFDFDSILIRLLFKYVQLPFDFISTALRLFDDLPVRYDSRPICVACGTAA